VTHELLTWVDAQPRTYAETIETWVSNCPRHPVWDDAVSERLVSVVDGVVQLTPNGRAALDGANA
jgi:hypothetical protein